MTFWDKLKIFREAWKSDTLIIVTDTETHVRIPSMDPYYFQNIIGLSAQRTALEMVKSKLDTAIKEHDKAFEKLQSEGEKNKEGKM